MESLGFLTGCELIRSFWWVSRPQIQILWAGKSVIEHLMLVIRSDLPLIVDASSCRPCVLNLKYENSMLSTALTHEKTRQLGKKMTPQHPIPGIPGIFFLLIGSCCKV